MITVLMQGEKQMEYYDLISRQAVKDIFTELYGISPIGSVFDKYEWADICKTTANELPSAQPDIIHCKDCKYHWTYKCMDSMPIEICDLNQTFYDANIDYCSLAERREDGRLD